MTVLHIATPYLIYLGNATNPLDAKTGQGLVDWRPELCVGQMRERGCPVDLGLPDMSAADAHAAGARSLVIGVAPSGGNIDEQWIGAFTHALQCGLDLVSGLHARLDSIGFLTQQARRHGRRLVDIRVPPTDIPLATGARRTGKRLLTVGTDCCVGKKYTALAVHRAMAQQQRKATFRATGQTGILIAGEGIAIDAVVADFVAGAAEQISPHNQADHWDLIEGQGSLFHPAYAGVTLGLIHGSQPDALVLCHEANRTHIDEYPGYAIPDLAVCLTTYLQAASITNSNARCIGISVNTRCLPRDEGRRYLATLSDALSLPCVDPMIDGVAPLIAALP